MSATSPDRQRLSPLEARVPRSDLPHGVEARPMGWWGMLLLMAVLVTLYAAKYFAYVYVRIASVDWPPEGFALPGLAVPAVGYALLVVAGLPMWAAKRAVATDRPGAHQLSLAAVLLLGGAHFALVWWDLAQIPHGVSEHAYVSLWVALPAIHLTTVACALIMAATMLLLTVRRRIGRNADVATRSLGLFWVVIAGGGAGLYLVVYVLPHVWRVAQVGS